MKPINKVFIFLFLVVPIILSFAQQEQTEDQIYEFIAVEVKPVVITEAGWTTASNGRGIEPWNASEELQASYYEQLLEWTTEEKVLTFVFEAFDEPWKGSPDPMEPEKHWGLFDVERKPKLVMQKTYAELVPDRQIEKRAVGTDI